MCASWLIVAARPKNCVLVFARQVAAVWCSGIERYATLCGDASLIATCKMNGVDPQAYLADVLTMRAWICAGLPAVCPHGRER